MALREASKLVVLAVKALKEPDGCLKSQVVDYIACSNGGRVDRRTVSKALELGVKKGILRLTNRKYKLVIKKGVSQLLETGFVGAKKKSCICGNSYVTIAEASRRRSRRRTRRRRRGGRRRLITDHNENAQVKATSQSDVSNVQQTDTDKK